MDLESSLELIERAQSGDRGALDRLLERYRPRLQRWASGRLPRGARDFADTEDLIQDALIGTFKNFGQFEIRGEWALQAYLRRAVTNRIRDEIRRAGTRPPATPLPDGVTSEAPSPLEIALGQEAFRRYDDALNRLEPIQREAVIARLELGCSYQEIATLIDRSSSDAARMFVARALAALAQSMAIG